MQLICGLFHLDARHAASEMLDRMLGVMQPRSLQAHSSSYVKGPVALGKLWVREAGVPTQLPQASSGLMLAADSRLDEKGPGNPADDQYLLDALQTAKLGAVLGDFALAAWDPHRSLLRCSRDGMGIRPLFYVYKPGLLFAFASRPAALLAAGVASSQLNTLYIANSLLLQPSGPQLSLFKDVQRVPPGSSLLVTPERMEIRSDWRLPVQPAVNDRVEPEEAVREARRLLTQAVRCRVPTEGALATHLSGGLDSSAVTLLAARTAGTSRVHAYSMLPDQPDHEDFTTEWPFVQAVLNCAPGLEWLPVHCGAGMAFIRPRMDRDQLMPLDDAWPDARILDHASQQQVSCLLSGWGGDEGISFNGRDVLLGQLRRGQWLQAIAQARQMGVRRNRRWWRILLSEVLTNLPGYDRLDQLRRKPRAVYSLEACINPELLAALRQVTRDAGADKYTTHHSLLRGAHLSQRTERWNLLAAHHGLSVLFPLLDRRVVEFAHSLPSHLFLRDGMRRWLFRQAVADLLPTLLLERPSKFTPIQNVHRILHASAVQARNWIATLTNDARVTSMLNVREIERRLAMLPMQKADDGSVVAATSLLLPLRTAAFLEQHS